MATGKILSKYSTKNKKNVKPHKKKATTKKKKATGKKKIYTYVLKDVKTRY